MNSAVEGNSRAPRLAIVLSRAGGRAIDRDRRTEDPAMPFRLAGVSIALGLLCAPALADPAQVARGRYLATLAGCSDCHTPGAMIGAPDKNRLYGGADVGFGIPGVGVFVGPNLTPDKATGLGGWSDAQIVAAITQGKRPDGRILSGVMPWEALSHLTPPDARAIVAYLRSLPPVTNRAPGPLGPNDKPDFQVSVTVPGAVYSALPAPK
jgi:mono/diheme cytochrome c family protein